MLINYYYYYIMSFYKTCLTGIFKIPISCDTYIYEHIPHCFEFELPQNTKILMMN